MDKLKGMVGQIPAVDSDRDMRLLSVATASDCLQPESLTVFFIHRLTE
jgi:hypothetical protein